MAAHYRQPGVFTTNTARTDVPQRPTAAAYGEGAALVDGAWMYSDGSTWTSMGGSSGDISAIVRDGSGNITSYTEGTTVYTITYNADGTVNTVSGGGETTTVSYSGGEVSGVTFS